MEGVPLDALRVDGAFLLERHRVTNLVSLDRLNVDDSRVEEADLQRFYLAGNRQTNGGDFGAYQPTPAEIRTIADRFVGPGLRIVQGSALHFEEFEDEQFTQAGVLHLAIPGVIDLRQPGESRLMLSDSTVELEQEFLLPGDIARKSFRAKLVVLSALDFAGASPSAFDTNTRFVREFLQAGAGSVIASLWTVGDRQSAEFWRRFYERLAATPSVSETLYRTRRSYLEDGASPESGDWAAFQLFAH
jgi:CHAT domain-containing protein